MFIKPFKVKSNNQLKGTERKKLCEEVSIIYPDLTEEEIQLLLPKKETINIMKIVTHNNQLGKIYCVTKVPMFFQFESSSSMLFPTIYTLWQHPRLLHNFTTCLPVVSKLLSGADLMLPGLILKEPITLTTFGKFPKGTPVSINTEENKAAVAVGITALSSEDMYMASGRGKCVEIFHVMGDTLCQLGKFPSRPNLGLPNINMKKTAQGAEELDEQTSQEVQGMSAEDKSLNEPLDKLQICADAVDTIQDEEIHEENAEETQEKDFTELKDITPFQLELGLDPTQEMDDLLEYCFLKACKTSVKANDLPMLASNFFKNHLIAACPPNKNIDIKKTRYKKLSVFLAKMKNMGIINTTVTKGVESLTAVKFDHPLLHQLIIVENETPIETVPSNKAVVSECYKVTADVSPVLSKFGYEGNNFLCRAKVINHFVIYHYALI